MRYEIEKADGNYSAHVPDLPGCVGSGAAVAEVEREIRGAIEFGLNGLREDGAAIPQPSSEAISVVPGTTWLPFMPT